MPCDVMWRDVMQVEASVRGHAGRAAHDHERQSLQHQAGKFCVLSVLFRFGVFRFVLIGVVLIRFVLLPFVLCGFNFALWFRFFCVGLFCVVLYSALLVLACFLLVSHEVLVFCFYVLRFALHCIAFQFMEVAKYKFSLQYVLKIALRAGTSTKRTITCEHSLPAIIGEYIFVPERESTNDTVTDRLPSYPF